MTDYSIQMDYEIALADAVPVMVSDKYTKISTISTNTPVTSTAGYAVLSETSAFDSAYKIILVERRCAVINQLQAPDILSVVGTASVVTLPEISGEHDLTYILEFDDLVKARDFFKINGKTEMSFDDTVSVVDTLYTNGLLARVLYDDNITISEEFTQSRMFNELTKVSDSFSVQLIKPDYGSVIQGTQFYVSSEIPIGGITIAPFKRYNHPVLFGFAGVTDEYDVKLIRGGQEIASETVDGGSDPVGEESALEYLPNGNLPEYTSVTGKGGEFVIANISAGVYVLISTAKGYTVGWSKVDVDGALESNLWIYPLSKYAAIEHIYNIYGHSYKLYTVLDTIDEVTGKRIIDGFLMFGDIYAEGAPECGTVASDGWLVLDPDYTPGTLTLMSMPSVGINGFFDVDFGEYVRQESPNAIKWYSKVGPKEFDGLCFRVETDPTRTVVLSLSLNNGLITPPRAAGGGGGTYGGGGNGSSGYSGSGDGSGQTTGGSAAPASGGSGWSAGGSSWGGGATVPAVKPSWNPLFTRYLQDSACVGDDAMDTTVLRGGVRMRQMFLSDSIAVDDIKGMPPRLTLTGILLDDEENPVANAFIVVKAVVNDVIMGYTTTDANGLYRLPNIESELSYYVCVCPTPESGYRSTTVQVDVRDKDIIDERALMYFESDALNKIGYTYYQESRLVLPPLTMASPDDRLLYGIVRDKITRESLSGTFVEVYAGHLDITSGDFSKEALLFCAYSGQDELFDEGYYEFYVPQGMYTVRATRNGYLASPVYHVTVEENGLRRDIEIDTIDIYGFVYDASVFYDTGVKVPLAEATVRVSPYNTTDIVYDYEEDTDDNGNFNIHYPATPGEAISVVVSKDGYSGSTYKATADASGVVRKIEIGLFKSRIYTLPV